MADYYMFNVRLWVIGQSVDPKLYYYADAAKTVNITLLDSNGNVVNDDVGNPIQTSISAVAGVNELDIGDWLSAVSKTWVEGTYMLELDNGSYKMYAPLLIVSGAQSLPVEETDKIEKIIVVDTVSNVYVELPPTTAQIPASNRFRTLIYQHNNKTKLGRLVSVYGTSIEFDTKWVRSAIVEFTIKFNSLNDMAAYLAKLGYVRNPHKDVVEAIGRIINNDPKDVVTILGLYGVLPALNAKILGYDIDPDNYEIKTKMLVRLGFGWNDVAEAVKWGLAVGAIAGGIAAGVAVTVGTFGLGTAAGIGIAAGAITFGIKLLAGSSNETSSGTGSDTSDLKDNINTTYQVGKQKLIKVYGEAITDLDNLHQAGEVSDTAYNILKQDIQKIYNTAMTVIEEIHDEAVKAIDEAYERGKKAMYPWIAGAGLGGAVLGFILGRR